MPFIKNGLSQSLGQIKVAQPTPAPVVKDGEKPTAPTQGK